jgi:hypothetical protein
MATTSIPPIAPTRRLYHRQFQVLALNARERPDSGNFYLRLAESLGLRENEQRTGLCQNWAAPLMSWARRAAPGDYVAKHWHEFRDPIHEFIGVRADERKIIDSRPFQRLRCIHQLALSYLIYPGATHKRFEHSLGVMELATRIFDTVTADGNVRHEAVRSVMPDRQGLDYWRAVLRAAALCHDIGHLPFSHAADTSCYPKDTITNG